MNGAAAPHAAAHQPQATYVVDASVAIKLFVAEVLAANARALFRRLADPVPDLLMDCPLITADERLANHLGATHQNVVWLGRYPG